MKQTIGILFSAFQQKKPGQMDAISVFAACIVPVYIWAILIFFSHTDAILLRGTIFQLMGTAGLVLLFALIEASILFTLLLALNYILPAQWFHHRFTANAAAFAIVISLWAVSIHMQGPFDRKWNFFPLLLGLAVIYAIISKFPRLEKLIIQIANKLIVIAAFYLAITLIGLAFYLPQLFTS